MVTKINTYTKTDFLTTKSKKVDINFPLFYSAAKSTLWKCHRDSKFHVDSWLLRVE